MRPPPRGCSELPQCPNKTFGLGGVLGQIVRLAGAGDFNTPLSCVGRYGFIKGGSRASVAYFIGHYAEELYVNLKEDLFSRFTLSSRF